MGDALNQVGRSIGKSARDAEFLKRRGGSLPQIDRTRGRVAQTNSFISRFVVNESQRKMALTLAFYITPNVG